jgi:hypothetical protein
VRRQGLGCGGSSGGGKGAGVETSEGGVIGALTRADLVPNSGCQMHGPRGESFSFHVPARIWKVKGI